jgi:hypothetical protein
MDADLKTRNGSAPGSPVPRPGLRGRAGDREGSRDGRPWRENGQSRGARRGPGELPVGREALDTVPEAPESLAPED